MSKKAREFKKLGRRMRKVWRNSFPQEDLEISLENLLVFGVAGTTEDENGNRRFMTMEEIDDALVRKPLKKKELTFNILKEAFLKG